MASDYLDEIANELQFIDTSAAEKVINEILILHAEYKKSCIERGEVPASQPTPNNKFKRKREAENGPCHDKQ